MRTAKNSETFWGQLPLLKEVPVHEYEKNLLEPKSRNGKSVTRGAPHDIRHRRARASFPELPPRCVYFMDACTRICRVQGASSFGVSQMWVWLVCYAVFDLFLHIRW